MYNKIFLDKFVVCNYVDNRTYKTEKGLRDIINKQLDIKAGLVIMNTIEINNKLSLCFESETIEEYIEPESCISNYRISRIVKVFAVLETDELARLANIYKLGFKQPDIDNILEGV